AGRARSFNSPRGEEVFFFPFTSADGSPSLPIPLFLSLTFFFSKATHGRGFFFRALTVRYFRDLSHLTLPMNNPRLNFV
ncbi:hypothetical protein, partial [Akkermansia sp.]|uniref:hypothetical protein n=1 Tax=Akkermansia sp. TaxID=1872421 RepID=UPI003AF8FD86